jgi:thiamine pyrophosphate-dependent acetolactate synthase large subunit-like protein
MTNVDRTNRMPRFTTPREDAIIFHIDMDVMKERMSMFYLPAQVRVQADSATVLKQILRRIEQHGAERFTDIDVLQQRMAQHRELLDKVAQRDSQSISRSSPANTIDLHQVLTALRQRLPENNLVLNESISNYPAVWMNLAPTRPGCEYRL